MRSLVQGWRTALLLAAAVLVIPACGGGSSGGVAGPTYTPPAPFLVPMSASGADALFSAATGPGGSFYAAGYTTTGPSKFVTVVKILSTGALDLTFGGGDGIATTAAVFVGSAQEIGIAVQPTGKIVVAATVANSTNADDRDVAVLRLNADGTPDTTFAGGTGTRTIDFNTGEDSVINNGTLATLPDAARGIAVNQSTGQIYVYAVARGEGDIPGNPGTKRADTDFAVGRLTVEGDLDASFAGDGKFFLDIALANATPRGISVLPNGSVLGGGYTNTGIPGLSVQVQPVIFKVTPEGELDDLFAGGFYHETVLTRQTEVYNFAVHGTHLVTAGYGRESGDINVWVSLRLNVTSGERDLDFGGAAGGVVQVAPSELSSNCRFALALPGNKTVLVGSTGSGAAKDAAFAVLAADGTLDPKYGAKSHVLPFGAATDDAFWGGAVSGTNAILVGLQVVGGTSDDAYALIFPLQ